MENKVIICKWLTKNYGVFIAVDPFSMDVFVSDIFNILEDNGTVKTTTMRIPCGWSYPNAGKAPIAGVNVYPQSE